MANTIDTQELANMLGVPTRQATKILREVNAELQRDGYLVLNTRPLKAPRNKVMERLGLTNEK